MANGSGLPSEVQNTPQEVQENIAQYGQAVVDRVNFVRDRVKPSLSIDASGGVDLWHHDQKSISQYTSRPQS